MFSKAVPIAAGFTRPMVISSRTTKGECSSTIGTYMVVNRDGWILTAGHLLDIVRQQQESARRYQGYRGNGVEFQRDLAADKRFRKKGVRTFHRPAGASVRNPQRLSSRCASPTVAMRGTHNSVEHQRLRHHDQGLRPTGRLARKPRSRSIPLRTAGAGQPRLPDPSILSNKGAQPCPRTTSTRHKAWYFPKTQMTAAKDGVPTRANKQYAKASRTPSKHTRAEDISTSRSTAVKRSKRSRHNGRPNSHSSVNAVAHIHGERHDGRRSHHL